MTSEVAVMNKDGVALAADSAVTMGEGKKIWTSANKIFALSKYEPIGIMIYGNTDFMSVPWETLVKTYRKELGKRSFASVEDYVDDFIKFLTKANHIFTESEFAIYFEELVAIYMNLIVDEFADKTDAVLEELKSSEEAEEQLETRFTELLTSTIEDHHKAWKKSNFIEGCSAQDSRVLRRKFQGVIREIVDHVFEEIPLTKIHVKQLVNIAVGLPVKDYDMIGLSGVVIAGFGTAEFFPGIQALEVQGITAGVLRHERSEYHRVTAETSAIVFPFAQKDMVLTFMEGVDPNYQDEVENVLNDAVSELGKFAISNLGDLMPNSQKGAKERYDEVGAALLEASQKRLQTYRRDNYIEPVTNVVAALPKTELASLAEALVSLTSLKRRVSMELETVGGPIDVAVISKGDGFIWIRRKHYFAAELNPQFYHKYHMEDE